MFQKPQAENGRGGSGSAAGAVVDSESANAGSSLAGQERQLQQAERVQGRRRFWSSRTSLGGQVQRLHWHRHRDQRPRAAVRGNLKFAARGGGVSLTKTNPLELIWHFKKLSRINTPPPPQGG